MHQKQPRVRVTQPPSRLSALVDRPGGVPRDIAIARGAERLEDRRALGGDAILALIGKLEAMIASAPTVEQLRDLRLTADRVISLATLFDMTPLLQTGKRLSDLLTAFSASKTVHPDAIAVHVNALRLLSAPDNCSAPIVANVLRELDRVLKHFGIQSRQSE